MTKAITTTKTSAPLAHAAPAPAAKKGLKAKHVMLIDAGDGAYTDDSVKVKPDRDNPDQVVFKCIDAARLLRVLTDAGLCATRVVKGAKHHIAFVDAAAFQASLTSHASSPLLGVSAPKLLS
jgi:hypothetical protein